MYLKCVNCSKKLLVSVNMASHGDELTYLRDMVKELVCTECGNKLMPTEMYYEPSGESEGNK